MPKFRLYLAIGLVLSLSSAVPSPVAAEPPTFSGDVAPILYRHCVECHRPGDIAPFSLLTYEDASRRAGLIASATGTHRMPPWKPEPDYGDFQGVRRLTDGEIATLRAWANEGVLRGDASQLPTPPVSEEGWRLGTPDRVLEMPTPFTIPAGGSDIYQCFVLPLDLAEDAVLSAVEFRPGTRALPIILCSLWIREASGGGGMEAARNRAIDALAVWVCDQQTSSVAGHRAPPQRGYPRGWAVS